METDVTGKVGSLSARLSISQSLLCVGGSVRGTLELLGGSAPERVGALSVRALVEHGGLPSCVRVLGRPAVRFDLPPGKRHCLAFRVEVRGQPGTLEPVTLQACVETRQGILTLTLRECLTLHPPPWFTAIAEALAADVGMRVDRWYVGYSPSSVIEAFADSALQPVGRGTRVPGFGAHLRPQEPRDSPFDCLDLCLARHGSTLAGLLTVNPRERTLSERAKAAAGLDVRRFPVEGKLLVLRRARGRFMEILGPYCRAASSGRLLPIPACAAGASAGELPTPAAPLRVGSTDDPVPSGRRSPP